MATTRARMVTLLASLLVAASLALSAGAALAQTPRPDVLNERTPVSGEDVNPCTGETFTFEGTLHFLSTYTETPSGMVHSSTLHRIHLQGESDSGAKYVLNSSATQSITVDFGDPTFAPLIETTRIPVSITRQGENGTQDDYKSVLMVHSTRNANGELTAEVLVIDWECK